jgi:hypothetical protein
VLGRPKREDIMGDDASEIWCVYRNVGEFNGDFIVALNRQSGVVVGMLLYPTHLQRRSAIARFGNDFIVTRYRFCPGYEDAEEAPVYESNEGTEYLEYRSRGIALLMDGDQVKEISYVEKPFGYESRQKCPSP